MQTYKEMTKNLSHNFWAQDELLNFRQQQPNIKTKHKGPSKWGVLCDCTGHMPYVTLGPLAKERKVKRLRAEILGVVFAELCYASRKLPSSPSLRGTGSKGALEEL